MCPVAADPSGRMLGWLKVPATPLPSKWMVVGCTALEVGSTGLWRGALLGWRQSALNETQHNFENQLKENLQRVAVFRAALGSSSCPPSTKEIFEENEKTFLFANIFHIFSQRSQNPKDFGQKPKDLAENMDFS